MKLEIRKIVTFEEEIFFEGGIKASKPLKKQQKEPPRQQNQQNQRFSLRSSIFD